jgi:S1-C subfamily serine protease
VTRAGEARAARLAGRGPAGEASADLLPVAAALAPGLAGGPALDVDGRVAGVVVGGDAAGATCIPAARIAELLR